MRIALLSSIGRTLDAFFPPIVQRWAERGIHVSTASSTESQFSGHKIIRTLSRKPNPKNLRGPWDIRDWLEESGSDVLITNTAVASFVARLIPQPCPVIYFCHGLHWNHGNTPGERLWQTLEWVSLRNTAGVITINSDDQGWFGQRLPADRMLRLAAGVGLDLHDYPAVPPPSENGQIRLIWAGEFSDRKRPGLAIKVFSELRALGVNASLTMCGDGDIFQQTVAAVRGTKIAENVHFAGHRSDIARLIAESHGLLMTSRWEGLPRIALEATAIGRPVFAFDVKGVRSLPEVQLAAEGDTRSLARLIALSLTGGDARTSRAREELDVTAAADRIETFARQIADRKTK